VDTTEKIFANSEKDNSYCKSGPCCVQGDLVVRS